jgi:hypothetical protein
LEEGRDVLLSIDFTASPLYSLYQQTICPSDRMQSVEVRHGKSSGQ